MKDEIEQAYARYVGLASESELGFEPNMKGFVDFVNNELDEWEYEEEK